MRAPGGQPPAQRARGAAPLASYAGPAPATRASGGSIRGERPSRRGTEQLERARFPAAFASGSHPPSRACCDRTIDRGEHHSHAAVSAFRAAGTLAHSTAAGGADPEGRMPRTASAIDPPTDSSAAAAVLDRREPRGGRRGRSSAAEEHGSRPAVPGAAALGRSVRDAARRGVLPAPGGPGSSTTP
ncbi:transposase [Streptomonospora arabica]|uniref:Transposase n=1 Tax=Streptomonospora arabica TaxID=412417 RepID=A0ABV9SKN6_9ACTN